MSNRKTTTIEISRARSFSFDQILKVMLTVEPLDTILEKLMMEKF